MAKRRFSAEQRRRQWFDQGEAALECITGRPNQGYVCPLCASSFSKSTSRCAVLAMMAGPVPANNDWWMTEHGREAEVVA